MQENLFLFGLIGGVVPDVIRIIQNRYEPNLPEYLKSVNFYVGFVLLVLLGGGAAYLMEATSVKEALAYGYAAPQIVSSLLGGIANSKGAADKGAARGGGLFEEEPKKKSLMNWWG